MSMKTDKFWRIFDRVFCAHWYWRRVREDAVECVMCGKVKPIERLKKKEVLVNEWGCDK